MIVNNGLSDIINRFENIIALIGIITLLIISCFCYWTYKLLKRVLKNKRLDEEGDKGNNDNKLVDYFLSDEENTDIDDDKFNFQKKKMFKQLLKEKEINNDEKKDSKNNNENNNNNNIEDV